METVRASATRPRRDWRLGPIPYIRQSAAAVARARARAISALVAMAGAVLAEARARPRGCNSRWHRHVESDPGATEHRLVADVRVEARTRAQDGSRHHDRHRAAS